MYFTELLRRKSEVSPLIMKFKEQAEMHWKRQVGNSVISPRLVKFCSDGGGENTSNTLGKWMEENSIKHDIGVPYDHAQLGKVERANRTLYEGAEAMRIFAGMPPSYWVYCIPARSV